MPPENAAAAGVGSGGRRDEVRGHGATSSPILLGADVLAELDALAAHVDGTFVLVVRLSAGRYRRRCFLTAAAAQRAAERATERGENATVYLAELKPLCRLAGGEL